MFKWQIAIDRHSPRLKPNHSHLPDPPHFSLLSTFKKLCDLVKLKKKT
jgi:hypothetical protein